MVERESVLGNTMDFEDELKTIDICAVSILRVSFRAAGAPELDLPG